MIEKSEVRNILLITAIGLCDAIQSKSITIDEAEQYLFSPYTMKIFQSDPEIEEMIHVATEFENLARLIPESLDDAIADVKKRAEIALRNSSKRIAQQPERWLGKLLN